MKKVIDNIIYILGVSLLIAIVVLKDKYFIMVSLAAIGLTIIGILLFINKNNYAPVVLPSGLSMSLAAILYRFYKIPLYKVVVLFFMLSLILIMIGTMIKYHLILRENLMTHKLEIAAKVVDLVKNPNEEVDFYFPVLRYEIEGESFDINYPWGFAKNIPNIGDKISININPNDYLDVYFKPERKTVIKNYFSSICVLILAAIVLIGTFK